ncbi:sulfite exporter TauE/SafE family protein [Prosthecobacter sp.]|uniref:sulfite exporter TauE/SafE family protein n=1 Tax=Prosthecobacter sp. TaxID=1965333 RepID=UPI001D9BD627|nr:sulfite exporter TauE/SafE family protein [Prosthecobacter sp.]MCB1276081.1 sulfite exporter TauE/SafE family protein [Prosthecobacter sp.]
MTTSTILTCLLIGILSGIVASLCGVGGGVVMVPAFVFFLKLEQKTAVATSLAIIIPTALMATTQNARSGFVDWKVAAITAVSASVFAYFGAGWLKSMSNETLSRIFGTILVVFGVKMLLQGKA